MGGRKGKMITVLHRGGYAQMITILHGGGFSRDPQKWLRNLCTTPRMNTMKMIWKRWQRMPRPTSPNMGFEKTHQSAESTTNIIPSVARVYDRQSGRTYVFKVDS